MNKYTYGVSKEIYSYKGVSREAYGLVVYADAEIDGTATIVAHAGDLSCDEVRVQKLADMCNELELAPVHFNDIVDDFICGDFDGNI